MAYVNAVSLVAAFFVMNANFVLLVHCFQVQHMIVFFETYQIRYSFTTWFVIMVSFGILLRLLKVY